MLELLPLSLVGFISTALPPLLRLMVVMAIALFAATLLESLHWTRIMARLASPLIRLGKLHAVAGASFSLAFISPASANALLAEAYQKKEIHKTELVLANLFNSTPTYLVHLPTLFSLVYAFLGNGAFIYIGLTFCAAILRTSITLCLGRALLTTPLYDSTGAIPLEEQSFSLQLALHKAWQRFNKRIRKILYFTIPCYIAVYAMQQAGWFTQAEHIMAKHASSLAFIKPEAFGIVALYLAAESGAAMSAAASLAHAGALSMQEIIMALMVGNIISSPMRAFRHQFPSYAGFFTPGIALLLVSLNQLCRATSLIFISFLYYKYFVNP